MDKTRDMRRGANHSRQIRPNDNKLFPGLDGVGWDFVSLEKRKDGIERLSGVGRASSSHQEMGCEVSDKEDDFGSQSPSVSACTSTRFKVPMKFFDDCNGVDHACVPHKLRSATKKRTRESISPPLSASEKLGQTPGGIKSQRKDGSKKYKLNMKQGGSGSRHGTLGPITKDEEEVVETLYALAGMFPDYDANDKGKLEVEPSKEILSALPEARESPKPTSEGSAVSKEKLNPVFSSRTADTAETSSKAEELSEETVKLNSLNNVSAQGLSELTNSEHSYLKTFGSVPQVNMQTMPLSFKNEPSNEKALCSSLHFGFVSEGSLESREQQETSIPKRQPELALLQAASVPSQLAQHSIKECKKNEGLSLWPGSSTASQGAGSPGLTLPSSTSKIPAWLDRAQSASSSGALKTSFSTDKVTKITAHKKSWKRCAAHAYISRLILILQTPDIADRPPPLLNHLKSNEGPKRSVIIAPDSFSGVKNGSSGVVSDTISNFSSERNLNEARSYILQNKTIYQDQQRAANATGAYSSHNQNLDFSLFCGDCRVEPNNRINRSVKGLEPLSQFQVPYLNPFVQHQKSIPLPMSQTQYSKYTDRLSVVAQKVQLQLPHYLGNPISSTPRTSSPQQLHHRNQQELQQQHQQRFWAAQLAAQYGPMTLLHNRGNRRHDPPTYAQAGHMISSSSVEVVDPKYIPISQWLLQQQQQIMAISSSSARIRNAYQETEGGGLQAGGALPLQLQLQLLCNENL